MPLESLLQLVETLRERISAHRVTLSQSEALTRYVLIDPLLRELGWDTEDPSMVVPEYRVPNNQIADYVLFNDRNPVIVVESKKLDEPLRGGRALDQGILYCAHTRASYFLLTDGNRWELFNAGGTIPRTTFNLSDDPPTQSCLRALALWRQGAQSGQVDIGETPVIRESTKPSSSQDEPPTPTVIQKPQPSPPSATQSSRAMQNVIANQEWIPIPELKPKKGDKPVEIEFPDQTRTRLTDWKWAMSEVVRWLIDNGYLDESKCPIQSPQATVRYLISNSPTHPTGKPMTYPVEVKSLHVETKHSASGCVRNAKFIIEHVGQDPGQFKVRFA